MLIIVGDFYAPNPSMPAKKLRRRVEWSIGQPIPEVCKEETLDFRVSGEELKVFIAAMKATREAK